MLGMGSRAAEVVESADTQNQVVELRGELLAERLTSEFLRESLAQIELMLDDRGWLPVGARGGADFTAAGRRRARSVCRFMGTANPLIKRGLTLRCAYVWGLGVTIEGRGSSDDGQDVNAVIQQWVEANRDTFTGSTAQTRCEWILGTDGEVFIASITDPVTGAVQNARYPADEIDDIITNPDDDHEPWFYLRTYTARELVNGQLRTIEKRVAYPALGYRLRSYPGSITIGAATYAVQPDTWVRHVSVNQPGESLRGVGDAFASLPWARAHKEFLEQWAILMRALAQYAWEESAPVGKARQEAQRIASGLTGLADGGRSGGYGQTFVGSPGYELKAVPKTGATIDADSGKPLASYVAAGMGLAVTILLGDPGQTGARAVAETLTGPGELEFGLRRKMWAEVIDDLCQHVIDSAVIAPQGALSGRVGFEPGTGRVSATLPDQDDRTIRVSFPPYDSVTIEQLAKAISDIMAAMGDAPGPVVLSMLRKFLEALKIEDIDELIDSITDDAGNLLDSGAGDVAARAFRRGEDPAAALA